MVLFLKISDIQIHFRLRFSRANSINTQLRLAIPHSPNTSQILP